MFESSSPPTHDDVVEALGDRAARYLFCVSALAEHGLAPEMRWFGPSSGWAPVFNRGSAAICGFAFGNRPLAGLAGIPELVERQLRSDQKVSIDAIRILDETPVRRIQVAESAVEDFRWVDVDLTSDALAAAFISLIEGKLRSMPGT